MSDNKKYYYLKLKDDFFDTDAMILLENMQDGHLYSNILLKLYLRSLKGDGKLMFNNKIPYNSSALAQVTRHSVGTVEKALDIFKQLELVEILDNGAIYMSDIQNFIGESSTEADRKREYRRRIENDKIKKLGQMSGQSSDKSPPEIEKEIDIELEKYIHHIFQFWNEQQIIKHRKMNQKTKSHINARLGDYSVEELKQAISNYRKVLDSDEYFWTHKWTLQEFMKPNNVERFIDDADPFNNFKKSKSKKDLRDAQYDGYDYGF